MDQMKPIRLLTTLTGLLVLLGTAPLLAQALGDARQLFDAGKYRDAIGAISAAAPPARLLYLQAQSHERLDEADQAARVYAQLAEADGPVWRAIAQSMIARSHKQTRDALAAASQAVSQDARVAEAHYQLGLALVDSQDFAKAAAAFDKAAELDPQWSYARYYAGLSYYKVKRIDLLAERFEAFLKLAPNAPERPEVESIMRTIRGR
jgi:tetratricopeptide (TPR) repeat protein